MEFCVGYLNRGLKKHGILSNFQNVFKFFLDMCTFFSATLWTKKNWTRTLFLQTASTLMEDTLEYGQVKFLDIIVNQNGDGDIYSIATNTLF